MCVGGVLGQTEQNFSAIPVMRLKQTQPAVQHVAVGTDKPITRRRRRFTEITSKKNLNWERWVRLELSSNIIG